MPSCTPPSRPAQHRILVVDDDADMLRLLSLRLKAAGHEVVAVGSAEAALAQLDIARPQLVLSDVRLPGKDGLALFDEVHARHPSLPVILLTAHGTIPDAVQATARGVFTYLTKPYDGKELLEKVAEALALSAPAVHQAHDNQAWRADIVSRSARMTDVLSEAFMVAQSDASVLLLGDSGSGKELLAQAIHRASPRASKPFVAVNCGAIPEALLESELFGHVKGAFTDAVSNHKGLFQAADGGTLLLDEVADMPLETQGKIVRALQEQGFERIGGGTRVKVDVRVLSTTNRDLAAEIAAGLRDTGLAPQSLEIELTESVLMHQTGQTLDTLNALKALGVGISVDDFGTGYSSLAYLKRYPIDKLKIDRSFVMDTPGNADDVAIVTAIIQMARSLQLKTVAEGVETQAQLELLTELGCDSMQGLVVSEPKNAVRAKDWLRNRPQACGQ